MPVIRINKTKNYSVMSNIHLKDLNLSLKAKGLLSLMLALPDDWDYSVKGLTKICKEEETAIENALGELKKYNYLVVTKKLPNETLSGRIEYEYNIFECPQEVEIQGVEKQRVENLPPENHPQINTKIQNTNNINNKKTLESLVETVPKKKVVKTTQNKNDKIISSLIRYADDFSEDIKQLIKNWLQELYDRKKGISKNALLIALKYLKEHYKETEWKSVIEKATLNGWRSFEYCNSQPTNNIKTNGIKTTTTSDRNEVKNQILKNNHKFL